MFSRDVTAAILVSQNNETAAMLVSQTSPVGVKLFSYANAFFCSNKFEGALRSMQRRRRQWERKKKPIGLIKTTTLQVHHAFLYISLPSQHDYHVTMPSFMFYMRK